MARVNPTKRGKLRSAAGVKKGGSISTAKLRKLAKHPDPKVATQAKFAINSRKMKSKGK